MAINIRLENIHTKEIKEAPIGFSWTTLFFGIFVPLLRGDIKWFIISLALAFFTFGISWLIFPFLYNKQYVKDLVSKGYIPYDELSKSELSKRNVYFRNDS